MKSPIASANCFAASGRASRDAISSSDAVASASSIERSLLSNSLTFCSIPIAAAISASSESVNSLGLAVGSASALTPAYLAELAPTERRGSLQTLFQLMITLGILVAYFINIAFLGHNILGWSDWRWMLGTAVIPALALFMGSLILPESPRYLVRAGKKELSHKVLIRLRPEYTS